MTNTRKISDRKNTPAQATQTRSKSKIVAAHKQPPQSKRKRNANAGAKTAARSSAQRVAQAPSAAQAAVDTHAHPQQNLLTLWQSWWQQWLQQNANHTTTEVEGAVDPAPLSQMIQEWADWWGKQLAGQLSHFGESTFTRLLSGFSAMPSPQQILPQHLWTQYAVHLEPQQQLQLQQEYAEEWKNLWLAWQQQNTAAYLDELPDRRFAAQEWQDHGMHELNVMVYLLNAKYLLKLADQVDGDTKTKNKIRFALQQWIDAVAPSNFLVTNPEAQKRIIETRGESLKVGMENMLEDLRKGRISQTDETAFEVGKNVATTPGQVIFQNHLFQLIQYQPQTAKVGARPLLIVPPCINKYYILDLQPDNSLVNFCVQQGHSVFLVSWVNASSEQAALTWDDYVEDGVIEAIHSVQQISKQETLNLLGFCIGGTLLTTALSTLEARADHVVESLTLLASMLDFSEVGVLDVYIDEAQVKLREQTIGQGGILPGRDLASAFSSLRPNDLVWNYVVNNYLKGQRPPAFDLLYWNSDSTNLPGPMFCWYLRNTYLENNLREPGKVKVCGEAVDFARIQVPTYVLATREDHIVPWHSAYLSAQLLGATDQQKTRFVLGASGHIAGVINPASKNKRSYWVQVGNQKNAKTLRDTPEQWFASASEKPGSWWHDWQAWVQAYKGPLIAAPTRLGNSKFVALEAAPGSFVKARA